MRKLLSIAIFSLKEGIRQRIFYGVSIAATVLLGIAVLVSGFFMRDISKILVDFSLSVVSAGGLLVPLFISINMLAGDLEKRTVFTVLSQPISRWHYIIGKFLGLSALSFLVIFFLSCAGLLAIWFGYFLYGPIFFEKFSLISYISASFFIYIGINVLTSLVILWCSLTTSSFLAMLLALASYLIGHSLDDIVSFVNTNAPNNHSEELIRHIVNYLQYIFPNLSAFDLKLSASHGIIIPLKEMAYLLLYGSAYSLAILMISIMIFNKRDIL